MIDIWHSIKEWLRVSPDLKCTAQESLLDNEECPDSVTTAFRSIFHATFLQSYLLSTPTTKPTFQPVFQVDSNARSTCTRNSVKPSAPPQLTLGHDTDVPVDFLSSLRLHFFNPDVSRAVVFDVRDCPEPTQMDVVEVHTSLCLVNIVTSNEDQREERLNDAGWDVGKKLVSLAPSHDRSANDKSKDQHDAANDHPLL